MLDELQALKARTDALEAMCLKHAAALQQQTTEIKVLSEQLTKMKCDAKKCVARVSRL